SSLGRSLALEVWTSASGESSMMREKAMAPRFMAVLLDVIRQPHARVGLAACSPSLGGGEREPEYITHQDASGTGVALVTPQVIVDILNDRSERPEGKGAERDATPRYGVELQIKQDRYYAVHWLENSEMHRRPLCSFHS